MSPEALSPVPGYTFVECIYEGSRTAVYRAVAEEHPHRSVVIKLLRAESPSRNELVRFRNQYAIAKKLSIPGIVAPLALEPWRNGHALIMEDFGGVALKEYAQRHELSGQEVLDIALQLTDILHDLYKQRVIHKDINPANILIHPETKQVKLIDFGIASFLPRDLPRESQENQSLVNLEVTLEHESQFIYFLSHELSELEKRLCNDSENIHRPNQNSNLNNENELLRQVVLNLIGFTENVTCLKGEAFDEEVMLPRYQASNNLLGLFSFHLHKLMLCYWFQKKIEAVAHIDKAAQYLSSATDWAEAPIFYFYAALTYLSQISQGTISQEPKSGDSCSESFKTSESSLLENINKCKSTLEKWAEICPENFQHRVDLVDAEYASIFGDKVTAIESYDRAILGAKQNRYLQEEALANELAAKFYLGWQKEKVAAGYMQEAYYCYSCWGAKSKTNDLEKRYPSLLRPLLQQLLHPLASLVASYNLTDPLTESMTDDAKSKNLFSDISSSYRSSFKDLRTARSFSVYSPSEIIETVTTQVSEALDFTAVLKSAQDLSESIYLDELLEKLSRMMLQNSGADQLALVIPDEQGMWQVRSRATLEEINLSPTSLEETNHLPKQLIQYVKNTQEIVLMDDVNEDSNEFDLYFQHHQSWSALCFPILRHSQLKGILYLKNQSATGIFTRDRITIINFLCTQAAISLENARLFESVSLKSSVIESATEGMAILENGRYVYLNKSHLELLGYQQDEIIGESWEIIYDAKELKRFKNIVFPILSQEGRWFGETTAIRKDGSTFPQEVSLCALDDSKLICICRDISDRKQLEYEQARLTAVLEATPDLIGIATAEGTQAWGNQQLQDFRPDLYHPGKRSLSDYHPDWVNQVISNEAIPTASQRGSWSGELAILDINGDEIPVSQVIIAHKSSNGDIEYFSTVIRDIRQQKQAEVNSRLLASVVESSDDAIITKDLSGIITSWNQSAMSLFGYRAEEAIGQPITILFPADRLEEEPKIIASLKRKERIEHFETVRLHKDGTAIDISVTISPLIDSDSNVIGASKIVRDIRDRKAAEQALKRMNEELEERVAERTLELETTNSALATAKEAADSASHAKSEFLANMSHELRTPLNGILGYAQILSRSQNISNKERDGVDTIYQCGNHLLNLINDILDISKIEARKLELNPTEVNLPNLLQSVVEMCRVRADERGIQFIDNTPRHLPERVEVDEKRLRQILINLLGNAIKFTDQGSVTLNVSFQLCSEQQVLLSFRIIDTGIGLKPEDLEKLFQSFEQVGDRQRQAQGTGLGLAISQRIVQIMGGDIQVQSQLGQGSEFSFEIQVPLLWMGEAQEDDSRQRPQQPGLQWRSASSDEEGMEAATQPTSEKLESMEELSIPSRDELQLLLQLSQTGRLRKLRQHLESLNERDERFMAFSQKIFTLEKQFKMDEIEALLDQYLMLPHPDESRADDSNQGC